MRALSILALLAVVWLAMRAPVLIDEFGAALTALQSRAQVALHGAVLSFKPIASGTARNVQPLAPLARDDTAPAFRAGSPAAALSAAANAPTVPKMPAFARVGPMVKMVVGFAESGYLLATYRPADRRSKPSAGDIAQQAYDSAAIGDRRAALAGFEAAAAAAPGDPRAAGWSLAARQLERRWSGSATVFARAAGPSGFASAALLGGGQSGAALVFTPSPLAARPLALTLRGAVAHDALGVDSNSAQGALGLRWQVVPGLALTGEWLVASGSAAANGWTARLSGGASGSRGAIVWSGYGEAGLVNANPYAAGQGFAGWRVPVSQVRMVAGAGVWGAVQRDGITVDRLDIGPSLRLHTPALPVDLVLDYRFRIVGNANPGNGVALTLAGYF